MFPRNYMPNFIFRLYVNSTPKIHRNTMKIITSTKGWAAGEFLEFLSHMAPRGQTPLMRAAYLGDPALVRELLSFRADPRLRDLRGHLKIYR